MQEKNSKCRNNKLRMTYLHLTAGQGKTYYSDLITQQNLGCIKQTTQSVGFITQNIQHQQDLMKEIETQHLNDPERIINLCHLHFGTEKVNKPTTRDNHSKQNRSLLRPQLMREKVKDQLPLRSITNYEPRPKVDETIGSGRNYKPNQDETSGELVCPRETENKEGKTNNELTAPNGELYFWYQQESDLAYYHLRNQKPGPFVSIECQKIDLIEIKPETVEETHNPNCEAVSRSDSTVETHPMIDQQQQSADLKFDWDEKQIAFAPGIDLVSLQTVKNSNKAYKEVNTWFEQLEVSDCSSSSEGSVNHFKEAGEAAVFPLVSTTLVGSLGVLASKQLLTSRSLLFGIIPGAAIAIYMCARQRHKPEKQGDDSD